MKTFLVLLMIAFLFCPIIQCSAKEKKVSLSEENQRISYALGTDIGNNLSRLPFAFDIPALLLGLEDKLKTNPLRLSDKEIQEMMNAFQKKIKEGQQQSQQADGEKNLKEGKAFLEENKKKPDIKVTASGLQYKVVKKGKGVKPKPTDRVKVHYRGTLIDGKEFDSSYKRGEPISFPLNGVIKGWTEGVQLMSVGAKYMFYIPSDLAYGPNPRPGGPIGPNATLIFEVELLGIN
jgi:FKBP-type peptidyl-prolyl cis-trans isomerase